MITVAVITPPQLILKVVAASREHHGYEQPVNSAYQHAVRQTGRHRLEFIFPDWQEADKFSDIAVDMIAKWEQENGEW